VVVFAAFKRAFASYRPLVSPVSKYFLRFSSHSCADTTCSDPSHDHKAPTSRSTDCWSCGNCVNFYDWFCKKCDYIQPPSGETNLFRLFGMYDFVVFVRQSRRWKSSCFLHTFSFAVLKLSMFLIVSLSEPSSLYRNSCILISSAIERR
jgi:hypothetical protein